MKNQTALAVVCLFAAISIQGSYNPINTSIEEEIPHAPCPSPENSPLRSSTQVHRHQAGSTLTNPHTVSPLDHHNLSMSLAGMSHTENPCSSITKKINAHRWQVTSRPCDLSENWRSDSCVDANHHAQSIQLSLSENERAFQKTYLAAALRGMNARQTFIKKRSAHPQQYASTLYIISDDQQDQAEEQDITASFKDVRSPNKNRTASKREERSLSNDAYWKIFLDNAFWKNN